MCELLVRVVDKTSADPYLDARCTKAGDVIVVAPDGHVWGVQEQSSAEWRIVKLPCVDINDVHSLLVPEPETDPVSPSRMLQRRAFGLDLLGLDAAAHAAIDSTALLALRRRKPALADPNVL